MSEANPSVVILAGPNGAGKSTVAPFLIRDTLGIRDFVNADVIASGLCAFNVESVALKAGRIMLEHLKELAQKRVSFAFETTLASRTYAPWIKGLIETGYELNLFFFALPDAELAIRRVSLRVSKGGHNIPAETARRRFVAGLKNLFELYLPLTNRWVVFDNKRRRQPRIVAHGKGEQALRVLDPKYWEALRNVALS